jgi:hypothetical protein
MRGCSIENPDFGHVRVVAGRLDSMTDIVELGSPAKLGEIVETGPNLYGRWFGQRIEPSVQDRWLSSFHITTISYRTDICSNGFRAAQVYACHDLFAGETMRQECIKPVCDMARVGRP